MAETGKKKPARRRGVKSRRGVSIALTPRGWRATWIDPDKQKRAYEALWALGITTDSAAAAWAQAKSKTVLARKAEIAAGAPRYTTRTFEKGVEEFMKTRVRLRESTLRYYRLGASHLTTWAAEAGFRETGELTGADLVLYRTWLAKRALRLPKRGAGRGVRKVTTKTISPMTVNHRLVITRTILNVWCELGLTPKLTESLIRNRLKLMKNETPIPVFLRGP